MKQRSLVLVTVDCLRADHVGFLGYSRPVTPFLNSLADSSTVFSGAIVAGTPTYFSFPGIMASRYPLSLGREVLGIAPGEPTIATALHQAGYATAAFLAGNPYLTARFGYDQGFESFNDFLNGESGVSSEPSAQDAEGANRLSKFNLSLQTRSRRNRLTSSAYDELYFWYCQWRSGRETASMDKLRRYPSADVIVDEACSWLEKLGPAPFFLWLHLMDPHHPYYPPEAALADLSSSPATSRRARFLNSLWNRGDVGVKRLDRYKDEILSLYDAGVYWVDKQISRLVQALQQFQRWDETVFALTADHGEEFLEHGARYHTTSNLPEQLIHVPLLLRSPDLAGAHRLPKPFSLIHLAPTLLEGLGVPVPGGFHGHSHWEQISAGELPGEPSITECVEACNNPLRMDDRMRPRLLAVRDKSYKLVVNFRENADRFYDLTHDPGERSPVPPGVLTRERASLLRIAQAHLQERNQNQNFELRMRARVRELLQSESPANQPAQL